MKVIRVEIYRNYKCNIYLRHKLREVSITSAQRNSNSIVTRYVYAVSITSIYTRDPTGIPPLKIK